MHNRLSSMRTVVLAVMSIIITACSSTTESTPAITVALSVSPDTVRPTDSAVVTLTIRNVTADTVALQQQCRPGTFTIGRIDGPPVAVAQLACTDVQRVRPLAPGVDLVERIAWRNVTLEELIPGFVLPPGQYRLRATVRYGIGNNVISAPVDVTVAQ